MNEVRTLLQEREMLHKQEKSCVLYVVDPPLEGRKVRFACIISWAISSTQNLQAVSRQESTRELLCM